MKELRYLCTDFCVKLKLSVSNTDFYLMNSYLQQDVGAPLKQSLHSTNDILLHIFLNRIIAKKVNSYLGIKQKHTESDFKKSPMIIMTSSI